MSLSTVVPPAVAFPRVPNENPASAAYNLLDIRDISSLLGSHRDYYSKTQGKSSSPERTERETRTYERPGRASTFPHGPATSSGSVATHHTDSLSTHQHGSAADAPLSGAFLGPSPRKLEHRVTMVPEKAWSIGTGELADGENGQVEHSINEALTGAEPNVRSRKMSHSLGVFRQGLPDEKGKKKDLRLRDKLSPTAESPGEVEGLDGTGEGMASQTLPTPDVRPVPVDRGSQPRSYAVRAPESHSARESAQDYFQYKRAAGSGVDPVTKQPLPAPELADSVHQASHFNQLLPQDLGRESRRESDGNSKAGECAEDGEESGEEKISSAVFLPHHQGLDESQDLIPGPGVPQRSIPTSRPLSQSDDFHPWLVKASEPEVDSKEESLDSGRQPREPTDSSLVAPEVDHRQVDDFAITDESETGPRPQKSSHLVSQCHEDIIHEHQWAPKQPLEAIELIPYKHQVGGHTTLWRFSRRAVCKQLNNRENEFYEKVERYHRDLLAFLPRYIGVLNVTFQKKPRRKSTLRKDDVRTSDRTLVDQSGSDVTGGSVKRTATTPEEARRHLQGSNGSHNHERIISQSIQPPSNSIPTVTFVDNQHILPRNLLQPSPNGSSQMSRFRSASASLQETTANGGSSPAIIGRDHLSRPGLQDRHANSWGATTVNKKLRNEVFNDAFLKQPIAIHRHQRGHRRPLARTSLQQVLRPSGSDPTLIRSHDKSYAAFGGVGGPTSPLIHSPLVQSHSDLGQLHMPPEDNEPVPKDVTGTSAPEPELLVDSSPAATKKKRRYSGTGLRRKPKDVQDVRGDLQYFEEADDAGYKGDKEDMTKAALLNAAAQLPGSTQNNGLHSDSETLVSSAIPSMVSSGPPSPGAEVEVERVERPVNPKEAQTQRDPRVEYFLLLEDLTAGMKRPCIMDLKMGTRQYGVEANPKKQKSQQGKCAKTTSRELGVRVCGLQVWDVHTQSYVFKDKYYGRDLKKGHEFQDALTRFLYDGVDQSSILRHIPTVLQKLGELEVIIKRLHGYRFYAASLLMFYDGEPAEDYDTDVEDSTTDFATDTEEPSRPARKNPREIDFKMADFANCVTAGDLDNDKPCPPRHPNEPDRGFLRGLRSLRKYFLRIQRDVRAELGLALHFRSGGVDVAELEDSDDDESVSE
ncbi:hypothetical protein B0T22DRAFT_469125 [Podospora appendiculata]|uniref:Kinase n=1 Tax=Podospora appendiculata TaxID=314037 RepID=A0AAE0X3L7_9PEZI|nr:hypothetical protein B0T22DRAFT_469125 [Podospora appendiculata]